MSGELLNWDAVGNYTTTTYTHGVDKTFTLADLKTELDLGNPVLFRFNSTLSYGVALCYVNMGTEYSDFSYYDTAHSSDTPLVLDIADTPDMLYIYHR